MLDLRRYGTGTNIVIKLLNQPRAVLRLIKFQDRIDHLDDFIDQQRQVFGYRKVDSRNQNDIGCQDHQQRG